MRITKEQLKQIIKEELSTVLVEFDLDSELASIGTGADLADKKRTHRQTRDQLLQTSIALQLVLELANEVRNKKSKFFQKDMPHGPKLAHYGQIKKFANILTTIAKQVKDSESIEENYQPKLELENEQMRELVDFIKGLGTEYKQVGYGGMTPDEREVDNLILGKLNLDFNQIVKDHADFIFEQFASLAYEELVPEKLRDHLKNDGGYIFRPMKAKIKRGY